VNEESSSIAIFSIHSHHFPIVFLSLRSKIVSPFPSLLPISHPTPISIHPSFLVHVGMADAGQGSDYYLHVGPK